MMKPFFESFKELKWEIISCEEVKPGIILFDFVMKGEKTPRETISIKGDEYIVVVNDLIQHIEVRNK